MSGPDLMVPGVCHSRFALGVSFSQKSTGSRFSKRSKLAGLEKRGAEFVLREIDKARAGVSVLLPCILLNIYVGLGPIFTPKRRCFVFVVS